MRIGISAVETGEAQALSKLTDQVRRAADEGFASVWVANIFGLEALTALAVAGSQVPGIELGTAVIPTYPRHPAVIAQQALTTALAIGPGRLALGIGLSHKVVIENMYGYSFGRPAVHMREYLSVLRPLLDGTPVSVDGSTLSAHIGLSTPRAGRVPVLLAAMAPRMLALAGEQADGTILWMTGPATIRDYVVPAITAAASAAGLPSPRVVCSLPVAVTSDPDAARARREPGTRHLRAAAVLPRDAGQGGRGQPRRRRGRRGRGRGRRAARGARGGRRDRLRRRRDRPRRGPGKDPEPAEEAHPGSLTPMMQGTCPGLSATASEGPTG